MYTYIVAGAAINFPPIAEQLLQTSGLGLEKCSWVNVSLDEMAKFMIKMLLSHVLKTEIQPYTQDFVLWGREIVFSG